VEYGPTCILPQLLGSGGEGSLAWCGVAAGDVGDVTVTHGLLRADAGASGRSHALDSSTSSPQPSTFTHRRYSLHEPLATKREEKLDKASLRDHKTGLNATAV